MSDFIEFITQQLQAFAKVEIRRMFGAHGVFYEGLMLAIIADDVLYLKADQELAKTFKQMGLPAFTYVKQNKRVALSYYQAPEESLEDPDQMHFWAEKSFQVARKAKPATLTN